MKKSITKLTLISTIALIGIGTAACSNSDDSSKTASSHKVAKKKAPEFHKIGDTVKVGKVTYTLKSVTTTDYRNEFADSKPKNVIKVVYHVKNGTKKDLSIGMDLDVYGPTNDKLKEYPIEDSTLDAIAAGKSATVTTGYGTNKLGKFELQFKPLTDFDAKAAKFKVNVK